MAVEDGATIAEMLGLLKENFHSNPLSDTGGDSVTSGNIVRALRLYQQIRKERTEFNVRGAESNRVFLHMPLGPELEVRDQMLREWDWDDLDAKSEWPYFDPTYTRDLMSFDAKSEARKAFEVELGGQIACQ